MMTGEDEPELAVECLRAGARTYLMKPVDATFFHLALRDALQMRSLLLANNRCAS
jgi:DNA-binding NarL/FixJ family response regulator